MSKIAYIDRNFTPDVLSIIDQADQFIVAYQQQDLVLTLRQLYYRFVASDLLANEQKEYHRLGTIISNGRLAGLIDWKAIEDRGRNLQEMSHWINPSHIIRAVAHSYAIDKWEGQKYYVECWVEKQALEAVIGQACEPLDCNYYACKGYASQSEMWRASLRFIRESEDGRTPVIIYLGDHDPSGLDINRDIRDRLSVFGIDMEINRIALTIDQIQQYNPPPNPTKLSDSRAKGYIVEFGHESWELDALEPAVLRKLIEDTIKNYCDMKLYKKRKAQEEEERQQLTGVSNQWEDIVEEYCDDC